MGGWRTLVLGFAVALGATATVAVSAGIQPASDVGAIGGADRLPNGWALEPAGTQVNTERAPTGVAVTPDGQGVYAVTSGIFDEAVESVNAATLVAVPTLVSSAFGGVAADGAGHVFASAGPQNELFRYLAAVPGGPLVDASLAGPAPQEPNLGIPVTGYPGAIVPADKSYSRLFVAGTLSVPESVVEQASGHTAVCPATDANTLDPGDGPDQGLVCSVVNVVDGAANPLGTPVVHVIPVGRDAYGMAFLPSAGDPAAGTLYVSNWADQTNPGRTGATTLQGATGTVSIVSVTHDGTGAEQVAVPVGKAPMGVALAPDRRIVVVANSADDTVSVVPVDPATGALDPARQVQTVDVGVGPAGRHLGTQPVAVSFSPDGSRLFVALAGLDAVEVLSTAGDTVTPITQTVTAAYLGQQATVSSPTYIPTGWWPDALAVGAEPPTAAATGGFRLYVANLKGQGAGPGYYGQLQPLVGTGTEGTLSAVDVPATGAPDAAAVLNHWTAQVVRGDALVPVLPGGGAVADPAQDPCLAAPLPGGGHASSALLCDASTGSGSLTPRATHVVFVLAENKTFDSYFGDTGLTLDSNADPGFTEYPLPVTTNQHRLASQFTLSDDFWNEGAESSVVGHSWWASGITTPDRELSWGQEYDQGLRGNRGGGEYAIGSSPQLQSVSLSGVSSGPVAAQENLMENPYTTLADDAAAQGLTTAVYATDVSPVAGSASRATQVPQGAWGEGPASGGNPTPGTDLAFPDTDRAQIFLHGQTPESHAWDVLESPTPPPTFGKPFPATPLRPAWTLDGWTQAYDACRQQGGMDSACQSSMPNFVYMTLPENHTFDVSNVFNPLNPTPQSMVADNDAAIGQIVQGLSKSPFWKNTAVFLSEDDNQFTGDHVDIHRTFLLTMGGLAARHGAGGHVSSQPGSFPSALKTAEVLLGLPPMTLFDWRAVPLQDVVGQGVPATPPVYQAVAPLTPYLGGTPQLEAVGSGVPPPVGPVTTPDTSGLLDQLLGL